MQNIGIGTQPPAKRQKIKLACQECRDRKTRCDGGRPICGPCHRKGLDESKCSYTVAQSASQQSYVKILEDRVRELEGTSVATSSPENVSKSIRTQRVSVLQPNNDSSRSLNSTHTSNSSSTSPVNNQCPTENNSTHVARSDESIQSQINTTFMSSASGVSPHISSKRFPRNNATRNAESPLTNMTSRNVEKEPSAEKSPAFLGSSSAVGFMSEVSKALNENNSNQLTQQSLSRENSAPWFSDSEEEEDNVGPQEYSIPLRRTADDYLNGYWKGSHPLQPYVCQQTFMKWYQSLWSGEDENISIGRSKSKSRRQIEQIRHCMLNILLALGCRYLNKSSTSRVSSTEKTEKWYFKKATSLLTINLMDQLSLQLVQILLLMAQYLQTFSLSNRGWVLVGMALRAAQGLALHTDVAGESQLEREERRRTWYYAVLLDRVQSMTFGRPLMLPNINLGPMPQIIDEEYLTSDPMQPDGSQPADVPATCAYFVFVVRLSNLTADILRLLYSSDSETSKSDIALNDYNSLLKLDEELMHWQADLPDSLRYSAVRETDDCEDLHFRFAILLHHRFLHSRILLFRRVVLHLAKESVKDHRSHLATNLQHTLSSGCIKACTTAAEELIEVLHPHIGTLLVPPAWYTVFLLYTSGTVLAVTILTPSFNEALYDEQKERLYAGWKVCIESLRRYYNLGIRFASKCLYNLQRMESRFAENLENRRTSHHTLDNLAAVQTNQAHENLIDITEPVVIGGSANDWSFHTDLNVTSNSWWPDDDMDWFINYANLDP